MEAVVPQTNKQMCVALSLVISLSPHVTVVTHCAMKHVYRQLLVEWKRNLMAHGDAREEK